MENQRPRSNEAVEQGSQGWRGKGPLLTSGTAKYQSQEELLSGGSRKNSCFSAPHPSTMLHSHLPRGQGGHFPAG